MTHHSSAISNSQHQGKTNADAEQTGALTPLGAENNGCHGRLDVAERARSIEMDIKRIAGRRKSRVTKRSCRLRKENLERDKVELIRWSDAVNISVPPNQVDSQVCREVYLILS